MKKQKIIIILLLVLVILLAFSVTCLADTSLKDMISFAVSANGNHPNVVILKRRRNILHFGFYCSL